MGRGSYQMSVVNLVQNQGNGILEGSIGFPRLFLNDIESFGDIDGDNRQAFYFWRMCSDFLLAVMSVSGFKSMKQMNLSQNVVTSLTLKMYKSSVTLRTMSMVSSAMVWL
jgi:hypothetical protein